MKWHLQLGSQMWLHGLHNGLISTNVAQFLPFFSEPLISILIFFVYLKVILVHVGPGFSNFWIFQFWFKYNFFIDKLLSWI
jgi:hypothetical protein